MSTGSGPVDMHLHAQQHYHGGSTMVGPDGTATLLLTTGSLQAEPLDYSTFLEQQQQQQQLLLEQQREIELASAAGMDEKKPLMQTYKWMQVKRGTTKIGRYID